MNEVRSTQIASNVLAKTASSSGASDVKTPETGKNLPEELSKAEKVEQPQAKDLNNAVANVRDYVQSIQRDIQFSVDEDLEQTVVKVLDSDSGEIIRQIPEDIFLELARRLKDDGEFRLLNALG